MTRSHCRAAKESRRKLKGEVPMNDEQALIEAVCRQPWQTGVRPSARTVPVWSPASGMSGRVAGE